ncbi:unnamed protein product [Mucor hiemalis]
MESLGKNDMIKSFWTRHLTFNNPEDKISQTQPVVIKLDKEIEPEVSNSIEQHIIKDCADDDKAFEHGKFVEDSTNQDEAFELKLPLEDCDNDFQ